MITCDQHDYIEIACTYRYPIKLTMKSGTIIEGIACDTALDSDRAECIKLNLGSSESLVVLNDVSTLEVLVENPHFKTISF